MLRVLHLADNPYMGGIASHILSVHDAFADRDDVAIEIAVLPGRTGDTSLLDSAKSRGITTHLLSMHHPFDLHVMEMLRGVVHERKIDVVHVHDYRGHIIAHMARLPVPVVATSHGVVVEPALRTRIWQAGHLRFLHSRPLVIAVSSHVGSWLQAQGIPSERVRVVYNAVVPSTDTSAVARSAFDAKEHDTVFLYVGRLVAGKGLERLIDAIAEVDDAVLVVVGDGPLRESLEVRAREQHARVKFAGVQANPWSYYRAADCVVLPSDMEALPMALIEAASLGVPAIGTAVGGIPEVVEDEVSGILIPPGNTAALVEAIDRMTDGTRRARYMAGAKQQYAQHFTVARMADELYSLYMDVR